MRRSLTLKFLAMALTTASCLASHSAKADTFTVTRPDDPAPSNLTCDAQNPCSFREAIIAANAHPGPDEISIPAGDYSLEQPDNGMNDALGGDLDILESDLTLTGAGANLTRIDAQGVDRLFHVPNSEEGLHVTISGLTLTGGQPEGDNGGAILFQSPDGSLEIRESHIVGNGSYFGAGIYVDGGLAASSTNVLLHSSAISDNTAEGNAGAIALSNASATIVDSTLSGNSAGNLGGAIHAIAFQEGDMRLFIYSSTITDNTTNEASGDVSGAINIAAFGETSTSEASLANTILAGNVSKGGKPDCSIADQDNGNGAFQSFGFNILGNNTCGFPENVNGDQIGAVPLLLPLGNYGGPTPTHALPLGSKAIDAGNDAGCLDSEGFALEFDQRGKGREVNGRCDTGAYELQKADLSILKTVDKAQAAPGDLLVYTITVTNQGPEEAFQVVVPDELPAGVTFVSATPADQCSNADNIVTCTLPSLAANASAEIKITVQVDEDFEGSLSNTATVSALEIDEDVASNSSTAEVLIKPDVPPAPGLAGSLSGGGWGCTLHAGGAGSTAQNWGYLLAVLAPLALLLRKSSKSS